MPSNLTPEIIVTVQNRDLSQCETPSGSQESEESVCNSNDAQDAAQRSATMDNGAIGEITSKAFVESSNFTANSFKENPKYKHHHDHQHQKHGTRKTALRKKGSKSSVIATAIDMVEGKPRLWVSPSSASAVRVQVTLHRPLNWQIVQTSSTGSIPSKIVNQASSSSKSTVTHSHSLSLSESLSFSISPSPSIHHGQNTCRTHPTEKGRVRFTELPRSRLGKHIEKIEENIPQEPEYSVSVSKSLCYCNCASRNGFAAENGGDAGPVENVSKSSFSSSTSYSIGDIYSAQNPYRKKRSKTRRHVSLSRAGGELDVISSSSENEGNENYLEYTYLFLTTLCSLLIQAVSTKIRPSGLIPRNIFS